MLCFRVTPEEIPASRKQNHVQKKHRDWIGANVKQVLFSEQQRRVTQYPGRQTAHMGKWIWKVDTRSGKMGIG
jgi:hypothetical protein